MSLFALELLRLATSAACAAGTVATARALLDTQRVRRRFGERRAALSNELRLAGVRANASAWLAVQACVVGAAAIGAVVLGSIPIVAPALLALLGPRAWLRRARATRTSRIEAQVDGWLVLLSNALKATPAITEAIASTVPLVEPPLRDELDVVVKSQRLGTPLDVALSDMADRVGSRVLESAVVALRVARRTGGNLHRTLEASAASLRELARVEAVVRTRTAEGRAQSSLVAVLPVPLVLVLEAIDPNFLAPLFASTRGHLLLATAVLAWGTAVVWARRIVAVDV